MREASPCSDGLLHPSAMQAGSLSSPAFAQRPVRVLYLLRHHMRSRRARHLLALLAVSAAFINARRLLYTVSLGH
jgi:hypothetical protein